MYVPLRQKSTKAYTQNLKKVGYFSSNLQLVSSSYYWRAKLQKNVALFRLTCKYLFCMITQKKWHICYILRHEFSVIIFTL